MELHHSSCCLGERVVLDSKHRVLMSTSIQAARRRLGQAVGIVGGCDFSPDNKKAVRGTEGCSGAFRLF